jgi:hypothetical protein
VEIIEAHPHKPILRLTHSELVLLSNAINETCEALDDCEFETRVGATREQARQLQIEIGSILNGGTPIE